MALKTFLTPNKFRHFGIVPVPVAFIDMSMYFFFIKESSVMRISTTVRITGVRMEVNV
jgi:hypothetical protein